MIPGDYFSRLYFDMSGTRSVGALQTALEMTDEKHILWGSDFPANANFKDSLNVVSRSILSLEQRNFILGENIQKILA
jgi:predicted TIM-barrel fold metal-dependent hydrolase